MKNSKRSHFTLYTDSDMPILKLIILGLGNGDALASSEDVKQDRQGMLEGMCKKGADTAFKWLEVGLIGAAPGGVQRNGQVGANNPKAEQKGRPAVINSGPFIFRRDTVVD